jgi:hypothetical protein
MSKIVFDTTDLPLVYLSYIGSPSLADNQEMQRKFSELWSRNQKYIAISDLSAAINDDKPAQEQNARWMKENESKIRELCGGLAFVIPSPMIRAIIRTFFFLNKPPAPYVVVDTISEAKRWAQEQMAALS